ncbi:MAG: fatty acid oxidation complex subunit alpha FadJ [Candidatus Brachytrichaceae bacterium NZ_4S206]|jgi:3-hydroxyacyl-CoA dehydrogenase/enoyl-CoA hydratase/3-hydroxybutyryl-CoA epimerase
MSAVLPSLTMAVEDGVAVITFDAPGPVNALNSRLAAEFDALFTRVDGDDAIRAVVLASGKPDTWIAGADIEELVAISAASEAEALSRSGQRMLDRLAALRKPVVAAIHGACLGGGLEVALACHWRVLSDHPKSVCALPEVQLGLLPGAGGTQRLPRLIGLQAALDLILTGKTVRPRKAKTLGLVDDLVHPAILQQVARQRARELAERQRARPDRRTGAAELLLEDNPLGRAVVFRKAREQVLQKTRGAYPAPLAALEAVAEGYSHGVARGLEAEAMAFGRLAVTEVCRELTFLFFATTALKKDDGVDGRAVPRPVRRLGIVGGGFMGAGIASVAVQQDLLVRVRDASLERIAGALRAVREVLEGQRKRKRLTRLAFDDAMARVSGGTDLTGFRRSDLVIEAVVEDLAVKHAVVREVEGVAPDAIIASNTSTIPIARIAEASAHPERVVGMHFFSPVHRMPLLEVIAAPSTSDETIATAVACGRQLGKTVIVVRDGPGFYVNRILAPYLNAAGLLLDEGAAIEAVDDALLAYGFPVGPITLLDEVGLDIAGKSGAIMVDAFGDRMAPSRTLQRVIEGGRTGRKGGRGFYTYEDGARGGPDASVYALTPAGGTRRTIGAAEMQDRCVLPMLNEAVRCLEDGIVRVPRDGDVGAVFGIGFPPFRGGPFRAIDALGAGEVVRRLEALDARFPGRYVPAARLRAMAARGERFYPATGKPL